MNNAISNITLIVQPFKSNIDAKEYVLNIGVNKITNELFVLLYHKGKRVFYETNFKENMFKNKNDIMLYTMKKVEELEEN